jgi:hypothetical protein
MLRYYPSFKVITNLNSQTGELLNIDGSVYKGKYYLTYNGKAFSGPSPEVGPSDPLIKAELDSRRTTIINNLNIPYAEKLSLIQKTNLKLDRIPGKPNSYQPFPTDDDYTKGYLIRYFIKKENQNGFIIEISENEYNSILNGTADYDIRPYQVTTILWKLTGPLKSTRQSQYNVIPGIVDVNQRLTETANKNFLGIVDFIGKDYTKFARPTM